MTSELFQQVICAVHSDYHSAVWQASKAWQIERAAAANDETDAVAGWDEKVKPK
jgi:hypothetical protein